MVDINDAGKTIDYLRSLELPDGVRMLVGGLPAMQKDSIDALLVRIPFMVVLVLFVTTLLMFLTFGSLVLPIKAALMSALGLGSTLGILTWIFIDGHGAGLLNFTPQPIMAPVLVLIIAIIYGLSTDYEVSCCREWSKHERKEPRPPRPCASEPRTPDASSPQLR